MLGYSKITSALTLMLNISQPLCHYFTKKVPRQDVTCRDRNTVGPVKISNRFQNGIYVDDLVSSN